MLLKLKKGQVTVFMILGIVLLFSFAFLYYVYLNFSAGEDYSDSTRSLVKASVLKAYVTKCLERSAIDGVKLLGQQGGKIFVGNNEDFLEVSNSKVLKGIIKSNSDRLPVRNPFVQVSPPFPYFGKDRLLSLCETEGPNKIISSYQSCLSYSAQSSVQKELNNYVDFKVLDCARLSDIFEGVTYDVPKSEVVLGDNKIYFNLNFPISYNVDGKVYEIQDFSYELDVRLKFLHEFVKALIKKDITEPDFDISNHDDYGSLSQFKQGFRVTKQDVGNNDVVTIDDFASLIDGHAYSFKFARENRAPFIYDFTIVESGGDVTISFEANDPDEDIIDLDSDDDNFVLGSNDRSYIGQDVSGANTVTITASDGVLSDEYDVSFVVS